MNWIIFEQAGLTPALPPGGIAQDATTQRGQTVDAGKAEGRIYSALFVSLRMF
jgi:hypothetical protein